MLRHLSVIATLLCAAPLAHAATFYVSTTGSDGNPGTEGSPFRWPQKCVDTMSAGDTCIVNAGTYSGASARTTISGKSGTSGAPITLRAATPAVLCSDPTNDPDGCEIDTAARTTIDAQGGNAFALSGSNADWWNIEGFEAHSGNAEVSCAGTSVGTGPNNINIRYVHFRDSSTTTGSQQIMIQYCSDVVVEHSYFYNPGTATSDGSDYGIQLIQGARNVTLRNLYFAGGHNHNIAVKRDADNITIERIVCEGNNSECIILGQNQDDITSISGGTSCPNSTTDSGTTATLYDHTSSNITIRAVFARRASSHSMRFGLRLINVSNADIQDYFIGPTSGSFSGRSQLMHDIAITGNPEGRCGTEPGNNLIRGLIMVGDSSGDTACFRRQGNGFAPSTLTIENAICHNPSGGDQPVITSTSGVDNSTGAWESTSAPTTTYRNYVNNDCSTSFSGSSGTFTQQTGAAFNCGTAPSGALTSDPTFGVPESVPDAVHNFGDAQQLWDWEGRYLPIINRFRTNQIAYEDAGTGNASPCDGTCDIGIAQTEFFFALPPGLWSSCATIADDEDGMPGAQTPWRDDRTGLVVDVDCAQKKFVIGRCDDPLDEGTCDADLYIRKTAYLQKKRTTEQITLGAGTTGSDADTSGTCWRTRATWDFTESLEDLTGIWVHVQADDDGGTHDCSAAQPNPYWAFQGAE